MSTVSMAVVVVNFGSHRLLEANVPDAGAGFQVVIVDNWYSHAERRAVDELCTRRGWIFVPMPTNLGFGAAANAGLGAIQAETFVWLNPDAQCSVEVLAGLLGHLRSRPLELVAPVIEDSTGHRVFQGVELLLRNGRMRRAVADPLDDEPVEFWLTGACLAIHRDALARVSGFADDYFLYWEDVDLSVRATRAGCTLAVRHDLVVVHDEGGTQGRVARDRAKSDTYYYYNCRNRLLFAARLLPRRRLLRWLLGTPGASWEILMRGGRRQLLHSRGPLRATIRGTAAGVVLVVRALVRRDRAAIGSPPIRH